MSLSEVCITSSRGSIHNVTHLFSPLNLLLHPLVHQLLNSLLGFCLYELGLNSADAVKTTVTDPVTL